MAHAPAPKHDRALVARERQSQLSEVLRRAQKEGPQSITLRGKPAAVLMSQEEFDRLRGEGEKPGAWLDRLRSLGTIDDFEVARNKDLGRVIDLGFE
jgi:prevent-host-death family protein